MKMKSLTTKLLIPVALTMILIGIVNLLIVYQNMEKTVEKTIGSYAIRLADHFSGSLKPEEYEAFLADKQESELYWKLREELNTYREVSKALYVYTLEVSSDKQKVLNLIDGQPRNVDTAAKIGQESVMPIGDILTVLNGQQVVTDIVNDPGYGQYLSALTPIKNKEGKVIGLIGVDMAANDISSISQVVALGNLPLMLATGLIVTGLAMLFMYVVIRRRIKPLQNLQVLTERIAHGDLSQAAELQAGKADDSDEIGRLHRSYRQMVIDLHEILSQVKDSSTQVAASAEELAASAEQSTQSTNQIVQTTRQVAEASETQRNSLNGALERFMQMADAIEVVVANSKETLQLADQASHASDDGIKRVETVVKQMNEINHTVQETGHIVEKLSERSQEIGNIVNMITAIAGQTNLLALNAAIEAARAGEQGRGFAVVADEVRKLAEQSGVFANQITHLIESIQTETEHAVTAMQSGTQKVTNGLVATRQVSDSFRTIQQSVADVAEKAKEASVSIRDISESSKHVAQVAESVGEMFAQSAVSSQHNVDAAQDQLLSMNDISMSSESLAKIAEEMQNILTKFKL